MVMRKRRKEAQKRIFAVVLTFMLLVGLLPPMSFAEGGQSKLIPSASGIYITETKVSGLFSGTFAAFCADFARGIDANGSREFNATITQGLDAIYAKRVTFLLNQYESATGDQRKAVQQVLWRLINNGLAKDKHGNDQPFSSIAVGIWNTYFENKTESDFKPVDDSSYNKLIFFANTGNDKQPLIIVTPRNVNKSLVITKQVAGVSGGSRTFDFDIYGNSDATNLLATKQISVTGSNSSNSTYNFTVPFVTFLNGASFSLYVKEMSNAPNTNWSYDKELKTVTFTYANTSKTVAFENEYNGKGLIVVNKEWKGVGPHPESVSFELYRTRSKLLGGTETEKVGQPHTLSAANQWTTTIGGLDKEYNGGFFQKTWSYYVVERAFEGSDKYSISYSDNVQVSTNDVAKYITITNDNGLVKGKITVTKNWTGVANPDQPSSIIVDYTGPDNTTGTLTLSAPDYSASIEPVFHKDNSVSYTFTERLPQDYVLDTAFSGNSLNRTVTMNKDTLVQSLTYTNKYVEPFGELTLTKNWTNEGTDKRFRPASVFFQLQKLQSDDSYANYGEPIEITGADNVNVWSASESVTGLPFGTYRAVETAIGDYNQGAAMTSAAVTLSKFGDNGSITSRKGGLSISNNFDNPVGSITVKKVWNDEGVDRPTAIDVTLTGMLDSTEVYSETKTLTSPTSGNTVEVTFEALPLDGTIYTVDESVTNPLEAGLFANYESLITNNGIVVDPTHRDQDITITNTLNSGTIVVTKVWNHGNDLDPVQDVTLTLFKVVTLEIPKFKWEPVGEEVLDDTVETKTEDGILKKKVADGTEFVKQAPVEVKSITLKGVDNKTTAIFDDLQLKDDEHDVYYYVEESPVKFYKTYYPVQGDLENTDLVNLTIDETHPNAALQVKNVYKNPKGNLTVTKEFVDGFNPNLPTALTVYLVKDGQRVDDAEHTFTFTSTDRTETFTFEELELGHVYTIEEDSTLNYGLTSPVQTPYSPVKNYRTGKVEDGTVTLVNTYNPETKDLNVEKHWQGTTGAAVTVTLTRAYFDDETDSYQTDTKFALIAPTVQVSSENAWKNTFKGLEIHGPNGMPYEYSVSESSADLYLYDRLDQDTARLYGEGMKDTLVITNKYSPNKAKLIIEKKWYNSDESPLSNEDLIGIERVEVRLYVDGVAEEATRFVTKNAEGKWELILENIDATKHYAVQEVTDFEEFNESNREVPNKESYVGFNVEEMTQTITINNFKNIAAPSISLTKEVVGKDSLPLINGKATFAYKLTVTNTGNRTLTNVLVDDNVLVGGSEATGITIGDVVGATYAKNVDNGGKFTLQSSESGSTFALAPGATAIVTYTVTVTASGTYDNIAHAEGTYNKIIHSSRNAQETVIAKPIGLVVEKSVSPSTINGTTGNFTFTVVVTNNGAFDLENVVLVDDMAGLEASRTIEIGFLPAQGGNSETGSHTRTFTYTLTTSSNGTHTNTATATGGYDGVMLSDSDPATFTLNRPVVDDEEDRPERPVTPTENVTETAVPEALPSTEAPQDVPETLLPLDVATLPKTGEIPATVFYGLGGLLGGIGVFMRRKK